MLSTFQLTFLLAKFPKYYLTNKKINDAGWLIAGRIAQMVISFFVSVIMARYLGPKQYGLVNYGMAYVAFFVIKHARY